MDELKPCPLCGSKAKFGANKSCCGKTVRIDCINPQCGANINAFNSKAEAIKIWNHRVAPENKALTLEQLRKMTVPCPLWEEETPSGDMTESRIGPVLFTGIHCSNEERACWVTSEAHHANARTTNILAGKINFYAHKPEGK